MFRLAILASHVIQYQDPFFRLLASDPEIDLTVIYCSLQGAKPYRDEDMKTTLSWDLEMLQGLADHVAGAFARLQAQSELRASEERLRLAIESAQLGTWDYDPRTGELELSPRCKELFGMPLNARPDPAAFMELVDPEDRKALEKAAMKALDPKGHGEFDAEYRARRSDGTERWLVAR